MCDLSFVSMSLCLDNGLLCRRISNLPGVLVSVDTFYAEVARDAVAAGAHIVNDVTAGSADTDMLRTVWRSSRAKSTRKLACILITLSRSGCGKILRVNVDVCASGGYHILWWSRMNCIFLVAMDFEEHGRNACF
jgi:hypothetical protein